MSDSQALQARLQQLRDAFDDSFTHAATSDSVETLDLLELVVGNQCFLVPVADVRSVHVARPIMRVPTASASLLGLVGLRGAILAVHDLGAMLGVTTDRTAPWLMVARQAPIAFGFQKLERHLRLPVNARMAAVDPQRILGAEITVDHGVRRAVIQVDRMVDQVLAAGTERVADPQSAASSGGGRPNGK